MALAHARRYRVRVAVGADDVSAAQNLRGKAFGLGQPDCDGFDDICSHMLIEDRREDRLAGCFRILGLANGSQISRSYSAQFYDLSALSAYPKAMIELGRFCIHPSARDPDILRAAWGAITAHVDSNRVGMLFGCTSFCGVDPEPYRDAFAQLARDHLAPRRWAPKARAAHIVPLKPSEPTDTGPDTRMALAGIPSLLRTYLRMGGWVSDHAVVDPLMNTIHVFTGLEVDSVPLTRQRLLRATLDDGGRAR